jgi:hypothetical protein
VSELPPTWIPEVLSKARFSRYLDAAAGDVGQAMALYRWNIQTSASFYAPLHFLEVTLRNSLHGLLRANYGRDDWWHDAPLPHEGRRKVMAAAEKAKRDTGREPVADDVVAHLTFGFWQGLLSRRADRTFWVPVLHRAFPGYRGPRRDLHRNVLAMVLFRNRIMHHEPIHHRDLVRDHDTIYMLLGYLNPDVAEHVREMDTVPSVLAARPRLGPAHPAGK